MISDQSMCCRQCGLHLLSQKCLRIQLLPAGRAGLQPQVLRRRHKHRWRPRPTVHGELVTSSTNAFHTTHKKLMLVPAVAQMLKVSAKGSQLVYRRRCLLIFL